MIVDFRKRRVGSLFHALFLMAVVVRSSCTQGAQNSFPTVPLKGGETQGSASDVNLTENIQSTNEDKAMLMEMPVTPTEEEPCRNGEEVNARSDESKDLSRMLQSTNPDSLASGIFMERRHASDIIHNLMDRSLDPESVELRQLITQRTQAYIEQLVSDENPQDPRKLLHFLAPKIPAIKHSPDIALRIQASRSDIDPGLAACILGVLGHVCELYDERRQTFNSASDCHDYSPIAMKLIKDRRLEQVLECFVCGINVQLRTEEFTKQTLDHHATADSIEVILDEENVRATGGLSIRDASRAAWGLSTLGLDELKLIGDERFEDLMIALSLRTRELLLARLQELRQGDLACIESGPEVDALSYLSEELARDTASAAWAFACARAYTDIRFAPLFEACCSILCQDPFELRLKAQEVEAAIKAGNIGTNDAVERLALSESDQNTDSSSSLDDNIHLVDHENGRNRCLIDWLRPNELTDVLWAVALHGGSETVSQDETALSETATVFREIAFERLLVWLKEENNIFRAEVAQAELDSTSIRIFQPEQNGSTEDMGITRGLVEPSAVELVDAASLLKAEKEALEASLHAEKLDDPVLASDSNGHIEVLGAETYRSLREPTAETDFESLPRKKEYSIFSDHDLCSIAWAAAELQDPLRDNVLNIIIDILSRRGTERLRQLSVSDLSNLAWGIGKKVSEVGLVQQQKELGLSICIASAAMSLSTTDVTAEVGLLEKFQPPELSRLIWATVTVWIHSRQEQGEMLDTLQNLCRVALCTAAKHLHKFSAEDVARITWGYLEVHSRDSDATDPNVMEALGKAITSIETALHQWESCSDTTKQDVFSDIVKQPLKFGGSFFGRSTTMVFDYQRLDHEESDESLVLMKRPRPLLKDLPVDPSTICKVLCSLAKLKGRNSRISGGENLLRIALRLLSSKNGRLLQECPLFDLSRLCGAVAETDMLIGRERLSHFVRRLVYHLNTAGTDSNQRIAIAEAAKLLWSLGELGITCNSKANDADSAHRRLEIVCDMTFVTQMGLDELTDRRIAKLFRGMVTTHLLKDHTNYATFVIQYLAKRIQNNCSTEFVCHLTETIGLLHDVVRDTAEEVSDRLHPKSADAASLPDILSATETLMEELVKRTSEILENMSAVELRRLLAVYTLSPIRADEVVSEIEKLLHMRRVHLREALDGKNGRELLKNPSYLARQLIRALKDDQSSGLASLSSLVRSFFNPRSAEEDVQIQLEIDGMDAEVAGNIEALIRSATDLERIFEQLESAGGKSPSSAIDDILQATLFEIGRCTELIAHYRRIDFESGQRKSRIDTDLQRDMTKRLLSRALP